ncbi:MAG: hypothetical protein AAFN30_09405 [Actinomycetota bacterium]
MGRALPVLVFVALAMVATACSDGGADDEGATTTATAADEGPEGDSQGQLGDQLAGPLGDHGRSHQPTPTPVARDALGPGDQLQVALGGAGGHGPIVGRQRQFGHPGRRPAGGRRLLRQTDGCHLGIGVGDPGDEFGPEPAPDHPAHDVGRRQPTHLVGGVGRREPARHVADGPGPSEVGRQVVTGGQAAIVGQAEAGIDHAAPVGVGTAAGSHQDPLDLHHRPVVQHQPVPARGRRHLPHPDADPHVDAGPGERRMDDGGRRRFLGGQHPWGDLDQRDLDPQAAERLAELAADGPAADHGHRGRRRGQIPQGVAGQGLGAGQAGNRREQRATPEGQHQAPGVARFSPRFPARPAPSPRPATTGGI